MDVKGRRLDGVGVNGRRLDGVDVNGRRVDGVGVNGRREDGLCVNGRRKDDWGVNGACINSLRANVLGVIDRSERVSVSMMLKQRVFPLLAHREGRRPGVHGQEVA